MVTTTGQTRRGSGGSSKRADRCTWAQLEANESLKLRDYRGMRASEKLIIASRASSRKSSWNSSQKSLGYDEPVLPFFFRHDDDVTQNDYDGETRASTNSSKVPGTGTKNLFSRLKSFTFLLFRSDESRKTSPSARSTVKSAATSLPASTFSSARYSSSEEENDYLDKSKSAPFANSSSSKVPLQNRKMARSSKVTPQTH